MDGTSRTATALRVVHGQLPYEIVGRQRIVPTALKVELSLHDWYVAQNGKDASATDLPLVGIRKAMEVVGDGIESLRRAYAANAYVPPIKVLAERAGQSWRSTGLVVDGAMRVTAAVQVGIATVEVELVRPVHEDTAPHHLFLAFNAMGARGLSTVECDKVLVFDARSYRQRDPLQRNGHKFAEWEAERTGLAAETILRVTKGEFRSRTPDQIKAAREMILRGEKVGKIVAAFQPITRQAIEKQRDQVIRELDKAGKSRAEITKQLDVTPETVKSALESTGSNAHHPAPRAAQHITGADTGVSHLRRVNPEKTRQALQLAVERADGDLAPAVEALGTVAAVQHVVRAAKPRLAQMDLQLRAWGIEEAREYTLEQAEGPWAVVDSHWDTLLDYNDACRIYRNAALATRDLPRLKRLVALAEHTLRAETNGKR